MPVTLTFENLIHQEELRKRLKIDFPDKIVRNIPLESGIQVRKSKLTTQNFPIKLKPKKGRISVGSSLDFAPLYCFLCLPLGIYILINRKKHKALQQEIVEKIKTYHNN